MDIFHEFKDREYDYPFHILKTLIPKLQKDLSNQEEALEVFESIEKQREQNGILWN